MALTKVGAGVLNIDDLFGFRNRIINGDMRIDQRNAGASVANASNYIMDRWAFLNGTDGVFSGQQVTDAPAGFINSALLTVTTADTSLTTTQNAVITQPIEGLNCSDLGWGSANAQTVTLSFWVKSSLTGTFGGSLRNSAFNRSYPFTYAISAADTWEYKTITIEGDTSGTWLTTNGIGIRVSFSMGAGPDRSGTAGAWSGNNHVSATGAVSVVGTNGATFYVTGVQLEVGTVATPFERRPFGTELGLCQRYFYKATTRSLGVTATSVNSYGQTVSWPVTMRSAPTISNASFTVGTGSAGTVGTANITVDGIGIFNSASNWTVGTNAAITLDASSEL